MSRQAQKRVLKVVGSVIDHRVADTVLVSRATVLVCATRATVVRIVNQLWDVVAR